MAEPTIIRVHPAANDGINRPEAQSNRVTVVIADAGAAAEVLVFPPGECVGCGSEFHYRGATWVVTGVRRDSGVLVAEPSAS